MAKKGNFLLIWHFLNLAAMGKLQTIYPAL